MQLLVFIYLVFLFRSFVSGNIIYIISTIVVGILFVLTVLLIRKLSINKTKRIVEKYRNNPEDKIEPFVNVNRDDWYIIQELPGLSRVQAKKVVWMRKQNGWYSSLDDFFKKNDIYDEEHKKLLSRMLRLK